MHMLKYLIDVVLDAKCVEADSGAIGGSNSAEFMVKSEVGEDDVVFCTCM